MGGAGPLHGPGAESGHGSVICRRARARVPYGAHGAAEEGAQLRPQLEEQVLVEVAGQVVVQALVQDGAVQAHTLARLGQAV